ncbi:uncharacterized protein N7503_011974 [Penicillium pulvis]|uniref:uncharacterized protein n=1 Tax=Penicillium pulvis TaxID=1562058 RepID=UPI002548FAA1|nr:uncharacterized protein N7503_011974 [Penicillium pulvis]KAJ5786762.1 hypothetical protein N7503_011974 [Penicillium pulvis]
MAQLGIITRLGKQSGARRKGQPGINKPFYTRALLNLRPGWYLPSSFSSDPVVSAMRVGDKSRLLRKKSLFRSCDGGRSFLKECVNATGKGKQRRVISFDWTSKQQKVFDRTKKFFSKIQLVGGDPTIQYHLAVDASDRGIGGVLFQMRNRAVGSSYGREMDQKRLRFALRPLGMKDIHEDEDYVPDLKNIVQVIIMSLSILELPSTTGSSGQNW